MEDYEVRSTARILASVKEQEARFERLTRALEEECHSLALLPDSVGSRPPLAWQQVVMQEKSPGDCPSLVMMQDHQDILERTVNLEEDGDTPTSHMSVVAPENEPTHRMEGRGSTLVKTSTPHAVWQVPLVPKGSAPMGCYTDSIDRRFAVNGDRYVLPQSIPVLARSYEGYNGSHSESPEGQPSQPAGPEVYGSLPRGVSCCLPPHVSAHVAQPQAPLPASSTEFSRLPSQHNGSDEEGVSPGPEEEEEEEEGVYVSEPGYSTVTRGWTALEPIREAPVRGCYAYPMEAELLEGRHPYPPAVYPAPQEPAGGRHSPSADSAQRDPRWRDPDLPEVIGMLGHPVDPVKSNAAAYLQHLCYENERVKSDVRQLRGVPLLVGLLDHPKAEVHRKACGALRNISYGRDHHNKVAIHNCDGIAALVRLLRRTADVEVREVVTGTLWNLSSYEPLKMVIINHALQTLSSEIIVPHSGWGRDRGEDAKPLDVEWTTVFKNTSGCLRNVSSDGAEARRRLRECEGLVDALLHALHSAVSKKDMDNKSVENCVCILRNLSYHVHKEVPGAEKFLDPSTNQLPGPGVPQRKKKDDAGCFGGRKVKAEEWFNHGRKNCESNRTYNTLELPKHSEPLKGFHLLYQPEVVRLYLSLLTESRNYNTLEAAAGALQNLAAGHWTWSCHIRARVRKEKGLPILVELLRSRTDTVVRAVAIALRNLAVDQRNKDLIGNYAVRDLVSNLQCGQQRPAKNLEEDTVVAVLNTLHEIVTHSSENARSLVQAQAVHKLVAIKRTSQSPRETKAACHVLQTVWSYKELRHVLLRDGWNKSHFQPTANSLPKGTKNGRTSTDDAAQPLMERNQGVFATVDGRERREHCFQTENVQAIVTDQEPDKSDTNRKLFTRINKPSVTLDSTCESKPQPQDSWV